MFGLKQYKIKPIKITQMLFIELEITMYLTLSVIQLHYLCQFSRSDFDNLANAGFNVR